MGLQSVELRFFTVQPTTEQLLAEARRLGGMDIEVVDQSGSELTVAFSGFPKGRVNISTSAQNSLYITDVSMVAPVLLKVLFNAGVSLGGHSNATVADLSLQLPLSKDAIRKAIRKVHFNCLLVSFWVILLFASAVALVVGVLWLLARYVF